MRGFHSQLKNIPRDPGRHDDCSREECDSRRVVDIVEVLRSYEIETAVHDPLADPQEAQRHYGGSRSKGWSPWGISGP